jgi:hypothetical protein
MTLRCSGVGAATFLAPLAHASPPQPPLAHISSQLPLLSRASSPLPPLSREAPPLSPLSRASSPLPPLSRASLPRACVCAPPVCVRPQAAVGAPAPRGPAGTTRRRRHHAAAAATEAPRSMSRRINRVMHPWRCARHARSGEPIEARISAVIMLTSCHAAAVHLFSIALHLHEAVTHFGNIPVFFSSSSSVYPRRL